MQTFLPYPRFYETARCLDNKRLGNQRVEAFTILKTLAYQEGGWKHHPAVKMWKGYEPALMCYFNAMSEEWKRRGFKHNMGLFQLDKWIAIPPWWNSPAFHTSHQSNLVRKSPTHYRQYFPDVPDNLPYVWPV